MTAGQHFIDFITDVLVPAGVITIRRMFGGAGVYADGEIFAIIDDDRLYFKTNEAGQSAFADEGMAPFTYETKNGPGQLRSYWQIPDHLLDAPDELVVWAKRAIAAARQDVSKPKRKIKRSP